MDKRLTIRQHVKKIIADELGYVNGWAVTEERFDTLCDIASIKIISYLRRQSRVARQYKCGKSKPEVRP